MRTEYGFDTRRKALTLAIRANPDAYYSLFVEHTGKHEPTFLEVEAFIFKEALNLANTLRNNTLFEKTETKFEPIFSNLAGLTYTESYKEYYENSYRTEGTHRLQLTDLGKRVLKIIEPKQREYAHKLMELY